MRRLPLIAIAAAAALLYAVPADAVVGRSLGAFIEGKVLPPGVGARVTAYPAVPIRPSRDTLVNDDGTYRLEVAPGTYKVVAYAPGYAYAGDDPPEASGLSIAYGQTRTVNFDLVPAASISGFITGGGEDTVVVAIRRSSLLRRQRFKRWSRADEASGRYTITELRPGAYDLVVIAPERGIVDGRGWLMGKPDVLSPEDRKAITEFNAQYALHRRRADHIQMLACFSRDFSDAAGNTYDKMATEAVGLDPEKPGVVVLHDFSFKALLLHGDATTAIGVVTQVSNVRHRGVGTVLPPERADFLVTYRKEEGQWRFLRMEPIRVYRELGGRVTMLTGHLCALPEGYVATYTDDVRLGNIIVAAGDQSTGHNYTFGGQR